MILFTYLVTYLRQRYSTCFLLKSIENQLHCVISVCYDFHLFVHHQSFVATGPNPPGIIVNDVREDDFFRVAAYPKLNLHVNQAYVLHAIAIVHVKLISSS